MFHCFFFPLSYVYVGHPINIINISSFAFGNLAVEMTTL